MEIRFKFFKALFSFNGPHKVKHNKAYVYRGQIDEGLLLARYTDSSEEILPNVFKKKSKIGKVLTYKNPGIDTSALTVGHVYSFRSEFNKVNVILHVQCAFADLAGVQCPVMA